MKASIAQQSTIKGLLIIACLATLASCASTGEGKVGDTNPSSAAKREAPAAGLAETAWLVEEIAGRGVIDDAQTTLSFDDAGRVSGRGGCNRYNGSAAISMGEIKFGPLAATRMACPEAIMDQEQRFFTAMDSVRGWSLDANGLLHLKGEKGETLVRLSRMAAK